MIGQWSQKEPVRLIPCQVASRSVSLPPPPRGMQTILDSIQKQISSFSRLWKTFLPMCTLFFFMALINTIVSSLALTLVVTAPGGGAQVLPFLTVYAALPASLLFMVLYAYASHRWDRRTVFTLVISAFTAFNLFFVLFLYPNHGTIHLDGASAALSKVSTVTSHTPRDPRLCIWPVAYFLLLCMCLDLSRMLFPF